MDDSQQLTTISELPAEILNHTFTFLLIPSVLRKFRFQSVGRSFWSSNLRDLRTISSVCKSWRQESVRYLYDYITIYRPHHLKALLGSLTLNPHYSKYVRRLEISAAGAIAQNSGFREQKHSRIFVELFQRCPNLTWLTIGPGLLGPWNSDADCQPLDWATALAPLSSQITDLAIQAEYQMSYEQLCTIIAALGPNLTSLSIQDLSTELVRTQLGFSQKLDAAFRLPRLRYLFLYCSGDLFDPTHWQMQDLRAMTIFGDYEPVLLPKYGAQLEYLCILDYRDFPTDNIQKHCTSLQHLTMSCHHIPPSGVKHIDFWVVNEEQSALVSTVSPTWRYFDADLIDPEMGFPALPYHFSPTMEAYADASFIGGDSHHIRMTEQGRVFIDVNCHLGGVKPVTTHAPSKPAEQDNVRSEMRVKKRLERMRKDTPSFSLWRDDLEDDSDPDSDWGSYASVHRAPDINYETDSSASWEE